MNISKFTQKSVQAVQDLEKIAYEYGNQEIEEEHLLYALLTQEDSLILKLIEKMEIQKEYFIDTVKRALDATRFGANIGLGGEVYATDRISVGLEAKYNIIKDLDAAALAVRVGYNF